MGPYFRGGTNPIICDIAMLPACDGGALRNLKNRTAVFSGFQAQFIEISVKSSVKLSFTFPLLSSLAYYNNANEVRLVT